MQNWGIFQGESPPLTKDASIFIAMVILALFIYFLVNFFPSPADAWTYL